MKKTPSPQSVVVPLEDWRHVIGALKNAKARLPMGAAIGNVSDALSKVEHLAAAPAPSSLAGGEWRSPTEVPETKKGEHAYRIVAVKRADGEKVVSFSAFYMNDVSLWFEDDGEARTVTGWHSDSDGDDGPTYSPLLTDGDALMGWREFPQWEAALSPEAPAREGGDLEELLTTAITAELEDGGAEVPYSVIAERVAARVVDEASAPSCALTTAAEEALSFLQNAPLESGICCCGDPISGHGYGSGHSPVDNLAYHSSQVAEKLKAALTPRHEAPACPHDAYETDRAGQPVRCSDCHEALDDHHERNLTTSNAELIEQALSHPPLEAPAEGAGEALGAAENLHAAAMIYEDQAMLEDAETVLSALRARSSAPEARS